MGNFKALRHPSRTSTSTFNWTLLVWLYGPGKTTMARFDNECVHAAKPAESEITDVSRHGTRYFEVKDRGESKTLSPPGCSDSGERPFTLYNSSSSRLLGISSL